MGQSCTGDKEVADGPTKWVAPNNNGRTQTPGPPVNRKRKGQKRPKADSEEWDEYHYLQPNGSFGNQSGFVPPHLNNRAASTTGGLHNDSLDATALGADGATTARSNAPMTKARKNYLREQRMEQERQRMLREMPRITVIATSTGSAVNPPVVPQNIPPPAQQQPPMFQTARGGKPPVAPPSNNSSSNLQQQQQPQHTSRSFNPSPQPRGPGSVVSSVAPTANHNNNNTTGRSQSNVNSPRVPQQRNPQNTNHAHFQQKNPHQGLMVNGSGGQQNQQPLTSEQILSLQLLGAEEKDMRRLVESEQVREIHELHEQFANHTKQANGVTGYRTGPGTGRRTPSRAAPGYVTPLTTGSRPGEPIFQRTSKSPGRPAPLPPAPIARPLGGDSPYKNKPILAKLPSSRVSSQYSADSAPVSTGGSPFATTTTGGESSSYSQLNQQQKPHDTDKDVSRNTSPVFGVLEEPNPASGRLSGSEDDHHQNDETDPNTSAWYRQGERFKKEQRMFHEEKENKERNRIVHDEATARSALVRLCTTQADDYSSSVSRRIVAQQKLMQESRERYQFAGDRSASRGRGSGGLKDGDPTTSSLEPTTLQASSIAYGSATKSFLREAPAAPSSTSAAVNYSYSSSKPNRSAPAPPPVASDTSRNYPAADLRQESAAASKNRFNALRH